MFFTNGHLIDLIDYMIVNKTLPVVGIKPFFYEQYRCPLLKEARLVPSMCIFTNITLLKIANDNNKGLAVFEMNVGPSAYGR